MLHETGNNISICTYNGTLNVDRQIRLDEICGNRTKTVTVTETHVNVLECDVSLTTTGKLIPPYVPSGNVSPYKEKEPVQTTGSPGQAAGKPREDVPGNSDLGRFSNFGNS